MKEFAYVALNAGDVEDSGFEAGPIEVETEIAEYSLDDEAQASRPPASPPKEAPRAPKTSAIIVPSPEADMANPPPPKKPVGRALPPKKAATKPKRSSAKVPAKKSGAGKPAKQSRTARKTAPPGKPKASWKAGAPKKTKSPGKGKK